MDIEWLKLLSDNEEQQQHWLSHKGEKNWKTRRGLRNSLFLSKNKIIALNVKKCVEMNLGEKSVNNQCTHTHHGSKLWFSDVIWSEPEEIFNFVQRWYCFFFLRGMNQIKCLIGKIIKKKSKWKADFEKRSAKIFFAKENRLSDWILKSLFNDQKEKKRFWSKKKLLPNVFVLSIDFRFTQNNRIILWKKRITEKNFPVINWNH